MKYNLDTNVTVMTLKIDDSGYPCPRYINRKGEFDIQNREMNLVGLFIHSFIQSPINQMFIPGPNNLEQGRRPIHPAD
jgi:hypothetical protein